MTDTEEGRVYNPWREFIDNVISGDNYFRSSEYRELLDYMDQHLAAEDTLARQLAEANDKAAKLADGYLEAVHERQVANARAEAAERRAAEVEALLREVSLTAWGKNGPLDLLTERPLLERIDAAIAAGEE